MQDRKHPAAVFLLFGVAVLTGATTFYCASRSLSPAHAAASPPRAFRAPWFPLDDALPVVDLAPDDDEPVDRHSLKTRDVSADGPFVWPALVRIHFSFAVAPSAALAPTGRGRSLGPRAPPVLNFDLRRLAWQA